MAIFGTVMPNFESFLAQAKDGLRLTSAASTAQDTRFIARNFLIEERVDASRIPTYKAELETVGPADFLEWNGVHNAYLTQYVFIRPPAGHDYRYVAPDDPVVCPETFRGAVALYPFQGTDLDVDFIRLVPVADIAWLSGENEALIYRLGEEVISDRRPGNPARNELSRILDEAYLGPRCDHRPLFAAFYEDFLDELSDPTNPSWPDRLRDRLGLYHINQWQSGGLPRRVFLFRYSVRDLPRHPSEPDRRPIAVPVVLDHKLTPVFCPAPRELNRGRVLNLKDNAMEEPARELLHLFMPMGVAHLFKVGLVNTPVPNELAAVRRDHLLWIRLLADRDNYAYDTDKDLFET